MPHSLNVHTSGASGASPLGEPLHPVLRNATENPAFEYRDFSSFNNNLFKLALNDVNWSPVFSSFNVNESLFRFLHF